MAKGKRKQQEVEDGNWVSLEEQERMELRRPRPQGAGQFVAPEPKNEVIKLPKHPEQNTYIDIAPSVRTQVDVRTSHVDRAKGFNIAITPLALVVGFLAVVVLVAGYDYPLFSLATLGYFWTTFAVCWVIGYVLSNIIMTPEFAGLLDVIMKWVFLFKERNDTWRHYRGKK